MADRWDGLIWKVQLAVFVFVALDAGRRVLDGGLPPTSLYEAGNMLLLILSVGAGVYVVTARQPVSALFGGSRSGGGDGDGREEP